MKKTVMIIAMLAASVCYGRLYFFGTRFDTTTTEGATYIGEAATNGSNFSETNAVWKIIKVTTNGVYNLEIGGVTDYNATWSSLSSYATNTPLWK